MIWSVPVKLAHFLTLSSINFLHLLIVFDRTFQVFAIVSGLDRNPSEIYAQYKSKEEVEQVFVTMKGDLEPDETHLRDNEKVKGFFLIIFLVLRIRSRILKMLKDHNLLGKMERIIEKSGAEYFAAVSKKVEKIGDLFKDMIPMG